jgi:hypothetical protein
MASAKVDTDLTPESIIHAIEQLDENTLEQVRERVIRLHAERRAPHLSAEEAYLLQKINETLPEQVWQRYYELVGKRKAQTLTPEEHEALKDMTNRIETAHARRMEYLVKLAQIRRVSLDDVMNQLGIAPPGYE